MFSDLCGYSVDSLQCKIKTLDVKLHGGGAWLWNFLIDIFKVR
jgi:hypothetical protein